MKSNFLKLCLAAGALALAGCVGVHKKSCSTETVRDYITRTNSAGNLVAVLSREEIRTDVYRDGGTALFADPKASELKTSHRNQTKLGGGSTLNVGELSSSVSTNTAPIIGSLGTAAGNGFNAANGGAPSAVAPVVTNLLGR